MSTRPFVRHRGGFGSNCWTDGVQFLKVWRGDAPPTELGLLEHLAGAGAPGASADGTP